MRLLHSKKFTVIIGLLLAVTLAATQLAGCSNSSEPIQFLAVQEEQNSQMTALISGRLVVDNGYLRVRGRLIIWPYRYTWKAEGGEIWVLDGTGQKVARVGDNVRMGGGEIPPSFAEEKIGRKLPAGIKGPFWLTGGITDN